MWDFEKPKMALRSDPRHHVAMGAIDHCLDQGPINLNDIMADFSSRSSFDDNTSEDIDD
jgi:hypothetical protein